MAKPVDHPAPGKGVQVAEGPRRHAVPEVVGPAPQHRVQPLQKVGKGLVRVALCERTHLRLDRRKGGLRRVGVHRAPIRSFLALPLDVEAEKSKPSSMWVTRVFSSERRRPIGESTAATSSRNASACSLVPVNKTTKSSAYLIMR